ncbi:MAG: choice-of-anchor D domain-containing protein [Verrucomicrobiota bacterium]
MNPTQSLRRLASTLASIMLVAVPTAATATDLNITAAYSGPASELDTVKIPGGNWGSYNLRLGNGASGIAITITSGTLYGADNGGKSLEVAGTNNTITLDGASTAVNDNTTKGWSTGSFFMNGSGNKLIISGGAHFTAKGWNGSDGTNNVITVTGAGSVAIFSANGSDGFGNTSGTNTTTTNRLNIANGGAAYVNNNGVHNFITNTAGTYAINVDGAAGRSVFGCSGFNDYNAESGGVLRAFNGGALETNGDAGADPVTWNAIHPGRIFIDGGVLSYKNATGVNMGDSLGTGTVSQFTFTTTTGGNAMRLNNSTATDIGGYTLSSNLGPKNYTRLEMINGTTAVARAITADGDWDGAIAFDGTTATITNGVTLLGSATFTATGTTPSTLTGVVGGGGSLVKAGSGKLTLNSAPTYSGDTTVNAGTLALAVANSNNETSVITLAAGAKLELAEGVADTVNKLYFGPDLQVSGSWGSSTSGATNKNDTYFAGKGTLTVTTGAVVPVIGVEQPSGTPLSTGGSVPFGDVVKGGTKTLTFTLKETGDAVGLTGIVVSVSGSSDYTVSGAPTTLDMGTSTTFDVTLTPTAVGVEAATILSIASSGISPFTINLTGTGVDGYAGWATTSGLTGSAGSTTDPAFDADPNKDGVKNGLAWMLGGDPLGNARARLPHATTNSSGLTLTFKRRSVIGASHLYLEYGDLAGNWMTVTVPAISGSEVGATFTISAATETGFDDVVCVIAKEGNLKRFARLMATEN